MTPPAAPPSAPVRPRRVGPSPSTRDSTLRRLLARPAAVAGSHPVASVLALGAASCLMAVMAIRAPGLVLGVLFLGLVGVLFLRYPAGALVLLFFLEPFHGALYAAATVRLHLGVGVASLWKDGLIGALFLRGLLDRLFEERRISAVLRDGGDRALVAYILLLGVIAALSPNLTAAGYSLAVVVEGPLLLLAVIMLRPGRQTLRACLIALAVAAGIMGATALIEQIPQKAFDPWFGGSAPQAFSSFILGGGSYRSGSFLASPLILGFYLAGATPIAAVLTIGSRGSLRWLALLATACCLGGLVVTYTRSGYIGGGIGILVAVALAVRNPRLRVGLLGMMLVASISAAVVSVQSGDDRLNHAGEGSSHTDQLKKDFDRFVAQPFGYGLGTVDAISQRIDSNSSQVSESTLFSKALQGGVEELGAYLVILFWTAMRLRAARRAALRSGDRETAAVCAGALGAMAAVFFAGFFLGVEALPVEVVSWGAAGIALAMARSPIAGAEVAARRPPRVTVQPSITHRGAGAGGRPARIGRGPTSLEVGPRPAGPPAI